MSYRFKVIFRPRYNYLNKENKAAILLYVFLNGESLKVCSTGHYVRPEEWDKDLQRVSGKDVSARKINAELDRIETDVQYTFRRLEFSEKLSLEMIKSEYLGKTEEEDKTSFLHFFDEFIELISSEVGKTRSKESLQKFKVLKKHFVAFLKKRLKRKDILITDISFKVITDFSNYLLTDGKCSHNTVMRMMGNFKTITIRAIRLGLLIKDPFVGFKIRFKSVDRGFLTEEEIDILSKKEFAVPRLNQIRDIFLFSCFTGLAYIDVKDLKEENIVELNGRKWIMTKRHKTNVETNVLLLDLPLKIIQKYHGTMPNGLLLPVISNQRFNGYLKEIADICGIKKRLTFHIARHTFATLSLTNGVSMEAVSKMLGHTNIRTTQIYAKIINKKVETEMLGLSDRLGNLGNIEMSE